MGEDLAGTPTHALEALVDYMKNPTI